MAKKNYPDYFEEMTVSMEKNKTYSDVKIFADRVMVDFVVNEISYTATIGLYNERVSNRLFIHVINWDTAEIVISEYCLLENAYSEVDLLMIEREFIRAADGLWRCYEKEYLDRIYSVGKYSK